MPYIIFTVCGAGLGTALLLKMTVEKALKAEGITNVNVQTRNFTMADTEYCDLLVITPEMRDWFNRRGKKNNVIVKDVMDIEEMRKALSPYLPEIRKKTQR